MKISFLVVNYFTADYVSNLVKSIQKEIKKYKFEILILDNSCDSVQQNMLSKLVSSSIKLFFLNENLGYTKGNNFLYSKSSGNIIVIINPDSYLIDNSLELMFDFMFHNNNIGVIGPKLLNEDLTYQISYYKFPTLYSLILEHIFFSKNPYTYSNISEQSFECDVIKGACLCIKRNTIEEEGFFDEKFFMYSEEVDLCKRLINNGKKNFYFPLAKIVHAGKKSSSQKRFTEFSLYHYYRSKIIYFLKYHNKIICSLVKLILFLSLFEKSVFLFVFNKKFSSKIHWNVLKKIVENNENLSNI